MTGAATTPTRAAALAAGVVAALRTGLADEAGLASFGAGGFMAGAGLMVTPGPAAIAGVQPVGFLYDAAEAVELEVPVTITLASYGVGASGKDDPFLDEVSVASAALALALRAPRSFGVGDSTVTVAAAMPTGRGGFREDASGQLRYECAWTTTLQFQVAVDPLPESFPGASPTADLDGYTVDASTA